MAEMPNGVLVIWNGTGVVQTVSPASHVFSQCAGCHTMNPGWYHGIGPDLLGVVGSPVARHANYQYSDSMRQFGGRWSPERLHAFLRDPQGFLPGTTMISPGIEDEATRTELINYLSEISRNAEQ
jgi:cytochrome c